MICSIKTLSFLVMVETRSEEGVLLPEVVVVVVVTFWKTKLSVRYFGFSSQKSWKMNKIFARKIVDFVHLVEDDG